MAYSNHNKYVSYPDWFGSQKQQVDSKTGTSTTIVYRGGGASDTGGGPGTTGITGITVTGSGNAVTSGILDGTTIILNKDLTFVTDQSSTNTFWELREDLNGKQYLYANYDIATLGGHTMYVDGDDTLNLPELYDGIPIDNVTIYWGTDENGNKVLKSVDTGSGGGGVADKIAWVNVYGKPSWITDYKPIYDYSEIQNVPDLSGFVTIEGYQEIEGVKNFLNGLQISGLPITKLSGYEDVIYIDANIVVRGGLTMYSTGEVDIPSLTESIVVDNITLVNEGGVLKINPDIQLGGITEEEYNAIVSMINTKWTQDNNKISHWDTAYGWGNHANVGYALKSYVDGNFVTLGTKQTITGEKNFTGGLKVNGSPIYYDVTNKYWKLEGDLLVTGGVTMYSDGTTSDDSSVYSTLGSLLNVDDSIDASASVDRVLFQAAGSSTWVTKPLSEIGGSVSGDYLPLSGGTLTGTLLSQAIAPKADNTYSFGYSNYRWAAGHFAKLYVNWNAVWHAGNDGSGSGLDADLLDGRQPSALSVLSASKLTTARTIWGQSFDGSGNVSGDLFLTNNNYIYSYDSNGSHKSILGLSSTNNLHVGNGSSEAGYTTSIHGNVVHLRYGTAHGYGLTLSSSGDIGIGTTAPSDKLHVNGGFICKNIIIEKNTDSNSSINLRNSTTDLWQISARYSSTDTGLRFYYYNGTAWNAYLNISTSGYIGFNVRNPSYGLHLAGVEYIEASSAYGLTIKRTSNTGGAFTQYIPNNQNRYSWAVGSDSAYRFGIYYKDTNSNIDTEMMYVDGSGNMLVTGGITMYSDQRKKTILNHVELSLKQIADAPLIEHYYNSDQDKTTHVGSIAQYWAGLNDWFCKLDAEGYYTMEIQNAALASAISIARHLERYESKTDKKIRMLKKRITELEDKIEKLEGGNYGSR